MLAIPKLRTMLYFTTGIFSPVLFVTSTSLLAQSLTASTDSSLVLVEQDGVKVSFSDVDAYMLRIPEKDRAGVMDSPKRIDDVITNILRAKLLSKEARRQKLDQKEVVKQAIELARDEVLARECVENYVASLKVPNLDELAKEQYLAQKEQFSTPPKVEVQHVLIKLSGRNEQDAKALAESVRQQAIANPGDFDGLVTKFSEDSSKSRNLGHIVDAASSRYAREFAEAAGALRNKGDISPVIQTKFGYHVLKLISSQPGQQKSFEEVKPQLVSGLRGKYIEEQKARFIGDLTSQKMTVSEQSVATLRTRYLVNGELTPEMAAEKAKTENAKGPQKNQLQN